MVATAKTGPIVAGVSATLCIDDPASATTNRTAVELYTCNGGTNQQWTVPAIGSLQVLGKCLDDPALSTTLAVQLEIYTCNAGDNQRWTLPT